MAKARKCDICGEYYDGYNLKNGSNGITFIRIHDDGSYTRVSDLIDLCPKCRVNVSALINGKDGEPT